MATAESRAGEGEPKQTYTTEQAVETLNDKAFAEFLGKFEDPEPLDPDSPEFAKTIQERHEAFENTKKLDAEIKAMVKKEMGDIHASLKFNDKELACITEAIAEMAVENPAEVTQHLQDIKDFYALRGEIAEVEGRLAKSEQRDAQWSKKSALQGQHAREQARLKAMGKKHIIGRLFASRRVKNLDYDIKELEEEETQQRDIEGQAAQKKERFAELRGKLFADRGILSEVKLIMGDKFKKLVETTTDPKRGARGVQETLDTWEKVHDDMSALKFLEDISDDPEEFRKDLEQMAETQIVDDLRKEVLKPFGNKALDDFDRRLAAFRDRARIGGKRGDEAKRFIEESLIQIRDSLPSKDPRRTFIQTVLWRQRRAAQANQPK